MLQNKSTFVDLDLCHSQWLDSIFDCVVVKCKRGRRIGTPVRAKGGVVVVLEWQWQEKTQSSRFRKLEPMHVSQPLCGAGPGGIIPGH